MRAPCVVSARDVRAPPLSLSRFLRLFILDTPRTLLTKASSSPWAGVGVKRRPAQAAAQPRRPTGRRRRTPGVYETYEIANLELFEESCEPLISQPNKYAFDWPPTPNRP